MEYVDVYRVEHRTTRQGPYSTGITSGAMTQELPEPAFDEGISHVIVNEDQIFGAPNKQMLMEWIENPQVLHYCDFVVRKYKVPHGKVISSKIQSIFYKWYAEQEDEWNIVDFCTGDIVKCSTTTYSN